MKIKNTILLIVIIFLFIACAGFTDIFNSGSSSDTDSDNIIEIGEAILPVYVGGSGTTYYVSNSGDDDDNGTTISTPWKTITKVNTVTFNPGDIILFNKDDTFTGPLTPNSGNDTNWIKYSSFGVGDKPKILGSVDLLNNPEKWELDITNIWKSTITSDYHDIGATYMNDSSLLGHKKWDKSSLNTQGDFYFNETDRKLYFYSTGNPADFYTNIDVAITTHVIPFDNTSYVLFEGLHITQGSAHGFGGSDTDHLIIRGCDFSYLGGGALAGLDKVRYGNGIEFWGNATNNFVDSNNFWEIYDTAVTNQNHTTTVTQGNIFYFNNVMRNCGLASFELWNRPSSSTMKNIYFLHNTSINPGHGWGSDRQDKNSFHIASFGNVANTSNLVIKNNIFYTSETPEGVDNVENFHLFFLDENIDGNYSNYIIDYNIWSMPEPIWAISTSDTNPPDSLLQWQEINNQSSNGITETPIFMDFNEDDFSLVPSSPGIDAGVTSLRTTDYSGETVTGIPDLGAFEY